MRRCGVLILFLHFAFDAINGCKKLEYEDELDDLTKSYHSVTPSSEKIKIKHLEK